MRCQNRLYMNREGKNRMKELQGAYASAKIFAGQVEDYALAQIQMICDNEGAKGSRIRIMPDVHPGKVGPVGLTMTVRDRVLPGLLGGDIGCGVTAAVIRKQPFECKKLDKIIREYIPSGFSLRKNPHRFSENFDFSRLRCIRHIQLQKAVLSLGTLGGGNHFIEIERDSEGMIYAAVHSGSRHLGWEVTEHYLREGQKQLRKKGKMIPYEMTWLEGMLLEDYLYDIRIVQEYAQRNRDAILDELTRRMKWKPVEILSCIHNYVETAGNERILRKGAVSAKKGETVCIPINMKDGILLGKGLGNPEWNESAPHGSGRVMSREKVKQCFTVSDYKKEMQGIYTVCINKDTLDEAPFAYRRIGDILERVQETVEIQKILTPVYSFKAGGEG